MGIALAALLAIFAGAHVAIAIGLVGLGPRRAGLGPRRAGRKRMLRRALLGLFVPPLAPWWGWEAGLRVPTIVWGAALALYAVGVAITGR
ncbi:MAG TPA: hypothetical protein VF765_19580 [Polyangiaceae bacterium]